MNKIITAVAMAIALLALGGCGSDSKINSAYDACKSYQTKGAMEGVELTDGGKSIVIEVSDDEDDLSDYGLDCILTELKTSDAIREDMSNTTAMMGRQTETDAGLTYRWTYHPDNGFNLTIR